MKSSVSQLVERLFRGEEIAAAKLLTMVENYQNSGEIIRRINPRLGRAYVVGITGAPGVGKSTLTDKLVKELRKTGQRIGIIAVDPTSPFSGGALLGDRIRLQDLAGDPGVFIRSMASRGHLGGISPATADAIKILDAFGCDYIFVETVGVGQSEIEIIRNVDTTVLVLIPGMGDEIQAIKAGIMEIADIFVINKADKDGVERTELEIEMLQNLGEKKAYTAPVQKVIARDNVGIGELVQRIREHALYQKENNLLETNRKLRLRLELQQIVHDRLLAQTWQLIHELDQIQDIIDNIYDHRMDIYSVADELIKKIIKERE